MKGKRSIESRRKQQLQTGVAGRVDDIRTMKKYTESWWGRVSELVFQAYFPDAEDMNAKQGNSSPYDFMDAKLGRVDVKGALERKSPQGFPMWVYLTVGVREKSDTLFLVGYSRDRQRIPHMWLVPHDSINAASMRFGRDLDTYRFNGDYSIAEGVLHTCHGYPDPVPVVDKRAWLDVSPTGEDKVSRGRRGELIYKERHPDSKDMVREEGVHSPYDFMDADGTRIDVKTSRLRFRKDRGVWHWSVLLRNNKQDKHNCDVYACVLLDKEGTFMYELRIPAADVGDSRGLNIPEHVMESKWSGYVV